MNIQTLRQQINEVDKSIISKLAERQKLAKSIGHLKSQEKTPVQDKNREVELMQFYETLCEQNDLDKNFVKGLFKTIIAYSRELQSELD